jgi:predicted protein tyrosine phosphatase
MMITKFPLVFSRQKISRYQPDQSAVLISITDSAGHWPFVIENRYDKVIKLKFDDVKVPEPGYFEMSDDQAIKIANFAKWANEQNNDIQIVVNCDAGISRSAAVAAAIAKYFLDDDMPYFNGPYRPNILVYRKVLENLQN